MRRHDFNWREGSLSADELQRLCQLALDASLESVGPIIEFGTLLGITAVSLSAFRHTITVDCYRWNPWGLTPDSHRALVDLLLGSREDVTVEDMHKADFCKAYTDRDPSLVFIDADHSYKSVKADIAWAKSVDAAIICGHDYCPKHPGVVQAVDEAGGPKELTESLWVLS